MATLSRRHRVSQRRVAMFLRKLFEPLKIRNLELKNRTVVPAMHANLGSVEEGMSDEAIDLFAARAKGGFGMIGVPVDGLFVPGVSSPLEFLVENDRHIMNHRRLTEAVKKWGAVIVSQVAVRRIWSIHEMRKQPKLSEVPEEKIIAMRDGMIKAGVRAVDAGYDAIEIQAIGGTALSIFHSQALNDRTDRWGGTIEKRLTMAIEVIKGLKKELGEDFPVFIRIHGSEFYPGGYTSEEEKVIAKLFEQAGADMISVSGGSHATSIPQLTPNVPRGGYAYLAREIKSVVSVPVATGTRINDPLVAEEILRKGWADLVCIARGSLADPEWPKKANEGNFEDIRFCVACNECLDRVVVPPEEPLRCLVNPRLGRGLEVEPLPKAARPKKVVVVGGGVVGLQAALNCSERGHEVTLFEQEPYLGGKWLAVSAPPGREEFLTYLVWLTRQVKKAGVAINTGVKVTPEKIRELAPDSVIVCTGAKPWAPEVPGINLPHVAFAQDVIEGKREVGQKIVVVGAGGVGLETALFLARRNFSDPMIIHHLTEFQASEKDIEQASLKKSPEITLVEGESRLGLGVGVGTRWVLLKELRLLGVKTMVEAPLKEVKKDGVVVTKDGAEEFIKADSVVLATGFVPDPSLYEAIKEVVPETYAIGNTVSKGHAIQGTGEALEVALKI